jgi:hypothetical protein
MDKLDGWFGQTSRHMIKSIYPKLDELFLN